MITNSQVITAQPVHRWVSLLRLLIIIMTPIVLTLVNVRLAMNPLFLEFEYNRPGFPVDVYGLTREERLEYAPYLLEYLLNDEGIDYLARLTFANGTPLFNERELRHMVDVKLVTQAALVGAVIAGSATLAGGLLLWRMDRHALLVALKNGALLTLSSILAIVLLSILAWDFFFTNFHNLFFEEGTWQFYYSDTLIRLFPEQLWFDAALLVGGLTVAEAVIIWIVCRRRK